MPSSTSVNAVAPGVILVDFCLQEHYRFGENGNRQPLSVFSKPAAKTTNEHLLVCVKGLCLPCDAQYPVFPHSIAPEGIHDSPGNQRSFSAISCVVVTFHDFSPFPGANLYDDHRRA